LRGAIRTSRGYRRRTDFGPNPDVGPERRVSCWAPPNWGMGRTVYSEQLRFACETRWPPYGKLTVRWTDLWEGRL
jgi:hypothetical protein